MTQPTPVPTPPPGDPAPAPTTPPTPAPSPAPAPPVDPDQPLGPAGKKALDEERAARKELEKQLAALAPLQQLAAAMAGGQKPPNGKSDADLVNERIAELEKAAGDERAARMRLEVAAEKGLTPQQAARLQGGTRDELAADADALLALFPTAPAGPRTPAPDPSQGARTPVDIDAQIRDAEAKGDVRTAILLKQQRLHAK